MNSRTSSFQLDPVALHSTLLSAHFLSGQPLVASSVPLSPLSELSKSQFLPSMLLASSLPRKPTPWYPWSLGTPSGLLATSNFESAFGQQANFFMSKEAKECKFGEGRLFALPLSDHPTLVALFGTWPSGKLVVSGIVAKSSLVAIKLFNLQLLSRFC